MKTLGAFLMTGLVIFGFVFGSAALAGLWWRTFLVFAFGQ